MALQGTGKEAEDPGVLNVLHCVRLAVRAAPSSAVRTSAALVREDAGASPGDGAAAWCSVLYLASQMIEAARALLYLARVDHIFGFWFAVAVMQTCSYNGNRLDDEGTKDFIDALHPMAFEPKLWLDGE